ncbi:MAG: hypothetical protein ACLQVG_26780 [Terriglobia bacterium]
MVTKSKSPASKRAALGFRSHSGWAAAAAVCGWPGDPVVIERRRIEIPDPATPGSRQPYHAGERIGLERAGELIRQCRDSSTRLAVRAVSDLVDQLSQRGFSVVGVGVLLASGRPLPDLPAILQSHAKPQLGSLIQ